METGAVNVRTNSNARMGGGAVLGESSTGTSPKADASAAEADDSASSCS